MTSSAPNVDVLHFRELADYLPHIVWMQDASGRWEYANRRFLEILGDAAGNAPSQAAWDALVPAEDLARIVPLRREAIARNAAYELEHRLQGVGSKDARWYLVRCVPVLDVAGCVRHWLGSATDIHDRKMTELALAEREAFTERILDSSDDCIKVLDLDGRLLSISPNGRKLLEIADVAPFIGSDWTAFWSGADRIAAIDAVAQARAGGVARFQGYFATLGGTPKWWDVVVSPIPGIDGDTDKLLAASRDVTELRTVSQALVERRGAYETLANAVPAIVFSATPDGALDYVNKRWSDYTGLTFEASLGFTWGELVHPDDIEVTAAAWRASVREGRTYEHEYRLRRARDGAYRWHLTRAVPLRGDDGTIVRWFGTTYDIEEQRGAYERERHWSNSFQRASLPPSLPVVPGLTFDAVYQPGVSDAQVGGDWYDALRLSDGRVLVSIGDVAGHGMHAAVIMGIVRQIMRGIAQVHADPPLMLDAADRALRSEHPDVFVTAWVGVFDLATRSLTYASAGHPPPLLVGTDGSVRELMDEALPLGLRDGRAAHATTTAVPDGSSLVLYTDGLTEATHDVEFGQRRLVEVASRLSEGSDPHPAALLEREVIPLGSNDDVAIMVARVTYDRIEPMLDRWSFDSRNSTAARHTREAFAHALGRRGGDHSVLPDAELVFGELVGNAARHAPGRVDVILDRTGTHFVLNVLDHGPGFRHVSRLPTDPLSESGRGLFIVSALSEEFSVSPRADGGSHARVVLRRDGGRRTRRRNGASTTFTAR